VPLSAISLQITFHLIQLNHKNFAIYFICFIIHPSKRVLSTLIDKYALETRNKLASFIQQNTKYIACTADGWTDAAHRSFLSVTGHFIDKDFRLHSRCLDVIELMESHTAELIESTIKQILHSYTHLEDNLKLNVVSFTTDNGANMLKAIRLGAWPGIECFAHTLQLCIKEGLDDDEKGLFKTLLFKIRKYSTRIHKSSTAQKMLVEVQQQNTPDIKPLMFIQDVKTRWNSTYLMLERLKKIGPINVTDFVNR
jgi:hypothetical protein